MLDEYFLHQGQGSLECVRSERNFRFEPAAVSALVQLASLDWLESGAVAQ